MKKPTLLFLSLLVLGALKANAGTIKESALSYIPNGEVVQEKDKEVKVKTASGTVVEVEFLKDGTFEEASGDVVEKDVFNPGQGLLSLKDALTATQKNGKTPTGDWSLEKSLLQGWHYDFEGFEDGKAMDYTVDAKTGKLLDSKIDD